MPTRTLSVKDNCIRVVRSWSVYRLSCLDPISDSQTNSSLPYFDPVAISKRHSSHVGRVSWVTAARERCPTNIPLSALLSETTVHPNERIGENDPQQKLDKPVDEHHHHRRVCVNLDGTVSYCEVHFPNAGMPS